MKCSPYKLTAQRTLYGILTRRSGARPTVPRISPKCFPSTLGMISANLCNVGPGDTFFLLIATDTASLIRRKCARFCSHQTLLLLLRLRLFAVSFTMTEVFHAPGPLRQNLIGALFSQCGELCHFSPQLCSCKKYSHMICKQLFITESTAFFFHSAPT